MKSSYKTKYLLIFFRYGERVLGEISLGGLTILVVIRTIQHNMLKMRDKYLHTNCLAALANMSSQFKNLHPYVCHRILALFEALSKRYYRVVATLKTLDNFTGRFIMTFSWKLILNTYRLWDLVFMTSLAGVEDYVIFVFMSYGKNYI